MPVRTIAKFLAAVATTLGASVPALAGPTYSGLTGIPYVVAYQSGIVTFGISTTPSSPWAACNTNQRFAINTASTSGQAIYDVVIRAEQNAKGVYIVGTGSCTLASQTEDVSFIQINP